MSVRTLCGGEGEIFRIETLCGKRGVEVACVGGLEEKKSGEDRCIFDLVLIYIMGL